MYLHNGFYKKTKRRYVRSAARHHTHIHVRVVAARPVCRRPASAVPVSRRLKSLSVFRARSPAPRPPPLPRSPPRSHFRRAAIKPVDKFPNLIKRLQTTNAHRTLGALTSAECRLSDCLELCDVRGELNDALF